MSFLDAKAHRTSAEAGSGLSVLMFYNTQDFLFPLAPLDVLKTRLIPYLFWLFTVHSSQEFSKCDSGLVRRKWLWWEYFQPTQNHIVGYESKVEAVLLVLTFWFPKLPSTILSTLGILSHFIPYSSFCEVCIVWLSSLSYETSEAQRLISCLRKNQDWPKSCFCLGLMVFLWILLICLCALMF